MCCATGTSIDKGVGVTYLRVRVITSPVWAAGVRLCLMKGWACVPDARLSCGVVNKRTSTTQTTRLTTEIPHLEVDVFVLHRLNVETDSCELSVGEQSYRQLSNLLGMVETTSPICSRYKMVVCTSASRPLGSESRLLPAAATAAKCTSLQLAASQRPSPTISEAAAPLASLSHLSCRVESDHEDPDLLVLAPEREGRERRVDPGKRETHGGAGAVRAWGWGWQRYVRGEG